MFDLSQRVQCISTSERAQRKITIPKGAIRMDIGEPDFPTPIHIQEAAFKAMQDNFTHYGNAYGDMELREAICFGLKRDYDVERKPENILVTTGGIEAIATIMGTYINPEDEVILLDPDYSGYADAIALFGGNSVTVPLSGELRPDLDAIAGKVSDRTKMIVLSNPSNPTGVVLTESEIRGLAEIVRSNNLFIVVDEVYHKLLFDNTNHFSICQVEGIEDRAIVLNSFSKTYAMTGWRVGYLVADENVVRQLVLFHRTIVSCVNTPSQKACVAALTGPQDCVEQMRQSYDKRRKLVEKKLNNIGSLSAPPCQGAFYAFPRFTHPMSSREMLVYLMDRGVLVRSGTEFGDNGEGHIRIAFTTSAEMIEEGMDRLKNALESMDK
jgi:aspartate/methionine/tyrosine aminotransferase